MQTVKQLGQQLARKITANKNLSYLLQCWSRKGILPSSVWHRLPVNGNFSVQIEDNYFSYESTTGDSIGRALYWRGWEGFEPETLSVFLKLIKDAQSFFDIGANTGIFTLIACAVNPKIKVVAFEPVPRVFARLKTNINANGFEKRVVVRNDAVSNSSGQARLHVPDSELPSSASMNEVGLRGYKGSLIEVVTVTLDQIYYDYGAPQVVKIDVEGFEDKVLEGMTEILQYHEPALIVECNPDGPYEKIESLLSQFNYRFFHILPDGPAPNAHIAPDQQEHYRNWLCMKNRSSMS
jgi:FkbM family methyltransferase